MEYGHVQGVDKPVSRLVQGTMMLSSRELEQSFALLDAVYALGCNTFDTAHVYGGGDCERTMGQWVNERKLREKVVIIGKGAHHNQDRKRVTPFDITSDIHDSLARFKFSYIDLYLLHRDDPTVPVGPIVEALNEHKRAGRIRAFGGSNWTHERIREANEYATAHGLTPFAASSPNFSLAEQVKRTMGRLRDHQRPTERPQRASGMPSSASRYSPGPAWRVGSSRAGLSAITWPASTAIWISWSWTVIAIRRTSSDWTV